MQLHYHLTAPGPLPHRTRVSARPTPPTSHPTPRGLWASDRLVSQGLGLMLRSGAKGARRNFLMSFCSADPQELAGVM